MKNTVRSVVTAGLAWLLGCAAENENPTPAPPGLHDKVYVADEDSGTVTVLDAVTNTRITTVDLMDQGVMYMPHNVQVAPDGKTVWVTAPPMEGSAGDPPEQLVVLDANTDIVITRILLGSELHLAHVVLDPSSSFAYITANSTNKVYRVNVADWSVSEFADVGTGRLPHGLRVCAGKLYVANMDGHSVSAIRLDTGATTELPIGGVAVQTACTPDQHYALVTLYDTREVVRIETATNTLTRIALPTDTQGPVQIYPSPDSRKAYVCDQGVLLGRPASNKLVEIDVDLGTVQGSITVGQGPHGVVVNQDGTRGYVTNLVDGTVSVVDLSQRVVVATITVGAKPNGVSHWHGNGGMP